MGKVKTTWLLPGHSGRPCHHEDIYTKMNKKTGQVYSVKLCNPNEATTSGQLAQRSTFGAMNSALSAWINQNKVATATDHSAYLAVKMQFDRQTKYATIRGYMVAKNMAAVQTDGSVVITIGTYTTTVSAGVVNNGTGGGSNTQGGGSNQGGGSQTPTQRTLTLSVSPAGAGTVTGAGSYAQGTNANITATAASGYIFSKWSDNNTSATRNVTVNSDMTLIAQFTVAGSGGGDDDQGGNDDQGGGDAF